MRLEQITVTVWGVRTLHVSGVDRPACAGPGAPLWATVSRQFATDPRWSPGLAAAVVAFEVASAVEDIGRGHLPEKWSGRLCQRCSSEWVMPSHGLDAEARLDTNAERMMEATAKQVAEVEATYGQTIEELVAEAETGYDLDRIHQGEQP